MKRYEKIILVILAVIATVLAIYLTPLKNLNLIEPRINTIDPKTFYDAYVKNPDAYVFIDVRPDSSYQSIHAPGSINVPLHTLYDERRVLPKRGKTIVLICSGNRASRVGYGYLEHYGFLNLMQIEGGIENWQLEGLPVETRGIL
ncbi:MAG: rhodanese-like domain-containing protein [bacterium]|nr:rhodanese-like domain-containing protein [bacterium]